MHTGNGLLELQVTSCVISGPSLYLRMLEETITLHNVHLP
jgi:hypothetical protein